MKSKIGSIAIWAINFPSILCSSKLSNLYPQRNVFPKTTTTCSCSNQFLQLKHLKTSNLLVKSLDIRGGGGGGYGYDDGGGRSSSSGGTGRYYDDYDDRYGSPQRQQQQQDYDYNDRYGSSSSTKKQGDYEDEYYYDNQDYKERDYSPSVSVYVYVCVCFFLID